MTLFLCYDILNLGDIMNKMYILEEESEQEMDELLVKIFDKILGEC